MFHDSQAVQELFYPTAIRPNKLSQHWQRGVILPRHKRVTSVKVGLPVCHYRRLPLRIQTGRRRL